MLRPPSYLVIAAIWAAVTENAPAEVISYDSGVHQVAFNGNVGTYYAVRFTNPFTQTVVLDAIQVYGGHLKQGRLDLFVWQDDNGRPGNVLASLLSQYIQGPDQWCSYDVLDARLELPPGQDIFAGFDPQGFNPWVFWDDQVPGAGRNWWVNDQTGEWEQGGPPSYASLPRNLMVRLNVVPEPPAVLLGFLATAILLAYARHRRGHL